MNQMSIFDVMYPKYKITKPVRLIEMFAGFGSQSLALKYLGIYFEHHFVCEYDKNVIPIYNQIHGTNYPPIDIRDVKGKDLNIVDTDKYDYILTYSFPCTDLSLAGKREGMAKGSGTRSGLLWEVERLLEETENKPQVLLMENVVQVHGAGNEKHFANWCSKLQELGYTNYAEDLIATDYNCPQTRNRCFMVSILGDYSYNFPQKFKLKYKLKNMLEAEVDEKYYLSDKTFNNFQKFGPYYTWENNQGEINTQCNRACDIEKNSLTIPTIDGHTKILEENKILGKYTKSGFNGGQIVNPNSVAPTFMENHGNVIAIPEATKQGYAIAKDGDGVYINRPHQKRGVVQENKIQTLKTGQDVGVVVGTYQYSKSDNFMQGKPRFKEGKDIADTIQTTDKEGVVFNDLRIRKLTPKECFRLMGVKDEDYNKIDASNSRKYFVAGNSICVTVLMGIFGEMFDIDYRNKIEEWTCIK